MDLSDHSYKPFMKPNSNLSYVSKFSNHPPNIIRNIPIAINDRLNRIASNEQHFHDAAPTYQAALDKSGHNFKLHYKQPATEPTKKKTRNRNKAVTWFNPPYSKNTNFPIGKRFLNLLDQCFPPNHPLRSIINRHTVKLSYSCLNNFHDSIKAHNKKILNSNTNNPERTCNCPRNRQCPLQGECLAKNIVYQATVSREDSDCIETYVGSTSTTFKLRLANHNQSFSKPALRNSTTLSKYIGNLKDNRKAYSIDWKILKRTRAYNSNTKTCNLCLSEKFIILCKPELCSLNSRKETMNQCRHKSNFLLKNYKNT